MAQLIKHVGKFGEKPCLVVFRELPGEADYCLIVQTELLDSRQHDDLMSVVTSMEAQESNDISQVLHRRQFTDGSNMLSSLHYGKKLQKVPVSHVALTPLPNQSVPLADVNQELRKLEGGYTPPKTDPASLQEQRKYEAPAPEPVDTRPIETDPTLARQKADASVTQDPLTPTNDVARNLMVQAELLEQDAHALLRDAEAKKAEAYRLNPELEPRRGPGRPPKKATAAVVTEAVPASTAQDLTAPTE